MIEVTILIKKGRLEQELNVSNIGNSAEEFKREFKKIYLTAEDSVLNEKFFKRDEIPLNNRKPVKVLK